MEKISWTEHNNKLRSVGNDWRRKSHDIDAKTRVKRYGTKKETLEMQQRKRQYKWSRRRLLFLQVFLLYFTLHIS